MFNVLFLRKSVSRMHYIPRCCFAFLFVCLTGLLHAQELRYSFKNYTPSDGLPSSETYQVLRDASNYMWFATDHGVTRYNGYEFETFNLPDNSIMGLYEDGKKRIWAFSFSGRLFYYENGKFQSYKWNDQLVATVTPGVIHSIYVDSADKVYISSTGPFYLTVTDKGIVNHKIDINKVAKFEAFQTDETNFFVRTTAFPGQFHNRTLPIYDNVSELTISVEKKKIFVRLPQVIQHERCKVKKLSDGRLIMYTKDGYCLISSSKNYQFINTTYTIDDVEEVDGNFFLATDKGLNVVNSKGETVEKYFADIHITSIEKDYEGGLWLTTHTNGVYYLNHFKIKHLSAEHEIVNKRFNIVYELSDSSMLAGTQGNELIRFKEFVYYRVKQLNLKNIVAFHQFRPDFVLVGGSVGWFGSRMWEEYKETKPQPITYFQIPNNSNFIIKDSLLFSGTNLSLLEYKLGHFKDHYNNIKQAFRVAKLFLQHDGTIVVGNHFGLWRYVNGYIKPYDSTKKILNSRITDIAYYKDRVLCLSTRGNGMLLLSNNSIYQVKKANGLVSDNIRNIYVDRNDIWLASNNGISIVTVKSLDPFQYSIRNITVQDGLLSSEINSIIGHGANHVVIASNSGISFINRTAFKAKRIIRLPLHVKEIKVNNEQATATDLLQLGFRKKGLNIKYEALNYGAAGKNNYRYRLSGYDTTWIYTNSRELQFNPVPYGSYTLEIQAKREYDQWDAATGVLQLPIVCKPPFWSTTWFWVAAFSAFTLLLILLFRNRINIIRLRQKQQEELKQKINDTEQMALKAQMNPHFIFNSLNSIQQYVIDSDVRGANLFISGFSRLIRQTLEFSSKEHITLEEEISYLSTYLDLEKARMESRFVYNVHVQTQQPVSHLEIPPLLLQPYVENALRHGIRYLKEEDDGLIVLSFIEHGGLLECVIEDNGIGREKAMELKAVNPIEYQSRGMSLTAERIALLNEGYENKIEVVIEDLKDGEGRASGTRIRVLFPV